MPSIVTVTYQLTVPVEEFRTKAERAAKQIARAPGLRWKIWGLDRNTGTGTSYYLFDNVDSAAAFAKGPIIAAMRDDPATIHVSVWVTPVDDHLSGLTFGAAPLRSGRPANLHVVA